MYVYIYIYIYTYIYIYREREISCTRDTCQPPDPGVLHGLCVRVRALPAREENRPEALASAALSRSIFKLRISEFGVWVKRILT